MILGWCWNIFHIIPCGLNLTISWHGLNPTLILISTLWLSFLEMFYLLVMMSPQFDLILRAWFTLLWYFVLSITKIHICEVSRLFDLSMVVYLSFICIFNPIFFDVVFFIHLLYSLMLDMLYLFKMTSILSLFYL